MKNLVLFIAFIAIFRTSNSMEINTETVISEDKFFSGEEPSVIYDDEFKNETGSIVMKINNKNSVNRMMNENMLAGKVQTDHLSDLLKVYDVRSIGKSWNRRSKFLTTACGQNMHSFLTALDKSELWALKMLDASGRYTTGFFWGNNYWTGSEALCSNVGMKRKHYTSHGNLPREGMNFTQEKNSPFPLGFYKIKAQLKLPKHVSPVRTILVGICAPFSCNAEDMRIILDMSLVENLKDNQTKVDVVDIRTPHNPYLFWQDRVFWILAGVTLVVSVFLFIGTFYDYYRERRYKRANRSRMPISESYLGNDNGKISNSITQSLTTNKRIRNVPGLNAIHDETTKFDDNSNTLDMNEGSSVNSEPELEMWEKFLSAFSIRENMKTICDHSVGADTIPTIHGLRSLSMAWVILGHTCIVVFKYSDNMELRTVIEKEFLFQAVNNGTFSVDTFFFISGLLVSFLYFRTTAKIDISAITGSVGLKSNVLQFLGLIAYRYGRLTAPYMFVLGCVQVSMKMFHENSLFEPPTLDHENCPNYWWRNAFYINTLFPVQEMCMLWSWYLADDTQFYILGIILLIIAVTHIKAAAALLFAFLISSWATTAYVAYVNNHMPSEDDPLALFDKIYDKPWTRLGPYLIGMVVGWVLFKTDCKIRMNKYIVVLGWLLSLTALSSLVYGLYDTKLDLITSSAYSSLSHSAWALGLSWVVIACSTGYGGFVNKLLSSSLLYPFSRVTYCAYLIHPLVIRFMIINNDSPLHLNKEIVMFLFFGQVVVSYILSFIVSLAFEAPVVSLLRILSPAKASKTVG